MIYSNFPGNLFFSSITIFSALTKNTILIFTSYSYHNEQLHSHIFVFTL